MNTYEVICDGQYTTTEYKGNSFEDAIAMYNYYKDNGQPVNLWIDGIEWL